MRREEYPITRYIPMNVVDSGRCLNGLLKTRNLIEAGVLATPIFFILYCTFPNDNIVLKMQVMSICIGIPLAAGIIGIPPYSLFEAIKLFFKFRKESHFAFFNPNLKMDIAPDFLVHATNVPVFTQLKNSFDILFGDMSEDKKEEAALTIENCTNEIHYKDSESELEWRKEQKQKEKQMRKDEKRRLKEERRTQRKKDTHEKKRK